MHTLLYADSGIYKAVESGQHNKNFVGFVAYEDTGAPGVPADVAVAWRGTITLNEWLQVRGHTRVCAQGVRPTTMPPHLACVWTLMAVLRQHDSCSHIVMGHD